MWGLIPYSILILQGFVYYSFVRYLKSTRFYKPSLKWWILIPFVVFNGAYWVIRLVWGREFSPPEWFMYAAMYPFYIWMAGTLFIGLWLLAGKLIKLPFMLPVLIAKIFRPIRERINKVRERKPVMQIDKSRRQFVRYATMGISAYAFGGAAYGLLKSDDYIIEYKDIVIDNLPGELKGTTITLISDIHSGEYMSEAEIRKYTEIVNDLGSDIICIPGDFVNRGGSQVTPLTKALRDLIAKHGVFGALGNHDYFMNGDYVSDALNNETPVQVLRNDYRKITINGKDLIIMGVDDARGGGARNEAVMRFYDITENKLKSAEGTSDLLQKTKILLCHKPYAFDELAGKGIELVLSGHTHGGQVVPFRFGDFNLSFAATASRYIEGLYKSGRSQMYVSRGLGTIIMPVRLNCPPEITVIKLI